MLSENDNTDYYFPSSVLYECPDDMAFEDGWQRKTVNCTEYGNWNDTYLTCGGIDDYEIQFCIMQHIVHQCLKTVLERIP